MRAAAANSTSESPFPRRVQSRKGNSECRPPHACVAGIRRPQWRQCWQPVRPALRIRSLVSSPRWIGRRASRVRAGSAATPPATGQRPTSPLPISSCRRRASSGRKPSMRWPSRRPASLRSRCGTNASKPPGPASGAARRPSRACPGGRVPPSRRFRTWCGASFRASPSWRCPPRPAASDWRAECSWSSLGLIAPSCRAPPCSEDSAGWRTTRWHPRAPT